MIRKILLVTIFISSLYGSKDELIINIMENAGVNYDINNLKDKIVNDKTNNILAKKFSTLYNVEKIKEKIKRKLYKKMSLKELIFLNNWYKSKIALKIKEANETTITKDISKKLLNANSTFFNDKERVLLIAKINQDLRYSAIDFYFLSKIFDYQLKKYPNIKHSYEIELYKQDKKLFERKIRNQTVAFLYYKYQGISTKSLRKYKKFLYTQNTYKFLDITQNTFSIYVSNILKLYMKN